VTEELPADLAKINPLPFLDHIVFGCLNLEEGCNYISERTGITPAYGGVHEGRGTHNALLGLGDQTYLEIVAPDPAQASNEAPLWMNITPQYDLRIIGWAAKSDDLNKTVARAKLAQTRLGKIEAGSRKQSNGDLLSWHLTLPDFTHGIGMIPFFVDWGQSTHPASSLPQLGQIEELSFSHSLPEKLSQHLAILETPLPCTLGRSAINLSVRIPDGLVIEL